MQIEADLGPDLSTHANAGKFRRNHFGIIEDQCIPGLQKIWQGQDLMILKLPLRWHKQEACLIARSMGSQGDVILRKIEVKKVNEHDAVYSVLAVASAPSFWFLTHIHEMCIY